MTDIVQEGKRDNVWLQIDSDVALDDEAIATGMIEEACETFEERLSIIATHVSFHKDVPERLTSYVCELLELSKSDAPVMSYPTQFAVGVTDSSKKVVSVISDNIDLIWYEEYPDEADAGLGDLFIRFNPKQKKDGSIVSGKTYKYPFVHDNVFADMLIAPSKGAYFAEHIRDSDYDYELFDGADEELLS